MSLSSPSIDPPRTRLGQPLRLQPAGRRWRPGMTAGSVALIAVCAALFTSLYVRAGHQVTVLTISRDVQQGQLLAAGDLSTASISPSPGLRYLPADRAQQVVGRTAVVAIRTGTLLNPADLSQRASVPTGMSVVGIAVTPSQEPAGGVSPGSTVDVVSTAAAGTAPTASSPSTAAGMSGPASTASLAMEAPGSVLATGVTVEAVSPSLSSSGSSSTVVSVLAPAPTAAGLAVASAAGQAALILVASSS